MNHGVVGVLGKQKENQIWGGERVEVEAVREYHVMTEIRVKGKT